MLENGMNSTTNTTQLVCRGAQKVINFLGSIKLSKDLLQYPTHIKPSVE